MSDEASYQAGMAAYQAGDFGRAAPLLARAILANPTDPAIHANLGNALQALGRLDEAVACFDRALALRPDLAVLYYNRANALKQAQRFQPALQDYDSALAIDPADVNFHFNRARALEGLQRFDEAIAGYDQLIALTPHLIEPYVARGFACQKAQRFDEAIADFRKAVALDPRRGQSYNILGAALFGQSRFTEAAAAFSKAIECDGEVVEFRTNLASAQSQAGHLDAARQAYLDALALDPEDAGIRLRLALDTLLEAPVSLAAARGILDTFDGEFAAFETWVRATPQRLAALAVAASQASPFYLAYRPADHTARMGRYGTLLSDAMAAASPGQSPRSSRRRGRRRLMFVSSHVRRHSVHDVITQGWLQGLDRSRFEIGIAHTSSHHDAVTADAAGLVDHFDQGAFPTEIWAAKIRDWAPDVVLYPEVGMDPATTALSALRLAPLQAVAWGHPLSSGMPSIDLFLSAAALEGPHAQAHYCERLIRLPGIGVLPLSRAGGESDEAGVRRIWPRGLPSQPVFIVPHSDFKLDPIYDEIYVAIAQRLGKPCQFVFFCDPALSWRFEILMQRLAALFLERGLDSARTLVVSPWLTAPEFRHLLSRDVVYLDPPAFSGFTTAWTALHSGVPVVSLEGEWLRQRLAAGLMRDIGLTDTIAHDVESYVTIACDLAGQPQRRAAIRAKTLELIAQYRPSAEILPALAAALSP